WWEGGALRFRGPSGFPERVPLPARPDRLSWAPDGTIVYARLTAQGARTTGELYRLTTDGVERRVASSGRARDAAADGECVLYVRETPDGSSLRRACPSGDALVYEAPAGWHLSTPAPGPGGALALTIWRPGGFLDVALLRGGRLELVTSDAAQDMEPAWGEGGRLFFTSDRGGSFQLHEASAAGLVRLSAAPGGVYSPSVAAGRAYFTSYGGEGVEVRGLDLPARGLPAATARAEPVPLAELAGGQYPVVPYAAELTAFWAPAGPLGPAGVHYLVASGGYSLATAGPEATLVYTLTPALGWQVGASAALEGASFTALASVANAGRAESQATGAFDYRFSVQAGLAAGRPEAMAALLLDALREDAFGYPESGWSLSLRASTSGAAGAHGRAAGSVAGVPLLVDGRLAGSHASATASLTVTARFSLRPQWRLGDGIVSLERVSVLPAFGVEHRLGQSGWLVGTTVALDGALHYHAPVTLGVQLQYRSLGGFSVALVTQVPLLEALTLVPKFGEPPPAPGLGWSSKEGP
ncbi:MAG TPA: hypothetical protein VNT60_10470, partial [Deinococcales bacterium]|nr:hypothetical protein [Deinococcales bacterium]